MDPALVNFLDSLFLTLHNLIRWLVIIFAILALVRAYRGWLKRLDWQPGDNRVGMIFTSVLDLQVLLGLVLYFLFSPYTPQLFANFTAAMKTPATAFFGVEHLFGNGGGDGPDPCRPGDRTQSKRWRGPSQGDRHLVYDRGGGDPGFNPLALPDLRATALPVVRPDDLNKHSNQTNFGENT